jgi:hypothetical protein
LVLLRFFLQIRKQAVRKLPFGRAELEFRLKLLMDRAQALNYFSMGISLKPWVERIT